MTIVTAHQKPLRWLTHLLWNELGWAWGLVAVAWVLLLLTGQDRHSGGAAHLHHHMSPEHLAASTIAQWLHAFGAWETMLVAMMLPSVLPVAKLFIRVSDRQQNRIAPLAFLLSYLTIWTGFSLFMVGMPLLVRSVLPLLPPPLPTQWIRGVTLIGVGLFQFTPLKQACLKGCRSATTTLAQYYQPGWQGGWQFGIQHGLFCLGCCWALMLEMAVLGMENLSMMLIFTAIMAIERLWKHGEAFAVWVGLGLIGLGSWTIGSVTRLPGSPG